MEREELQTRKENFSASIERHHIIARSFLNAKKNKNSIIAGQPKSGKSLLLRQMRRRFDSGREFRSMLLELSRTAMTPEFYSLFVLKEAEKEFGLEESLAGIINEARESIEGELLKLKPDHQSMIKATALLLRKITLELKNEKKKLVVLIDDAEEILQLENFPQIDNILELTGIIAKEENALFIMSTTYPKLFKEMENFETLFLKSYDKEEVENFRKTNNFGKEWERISNLTENHPYLLNSLARSLRENETFEDAVFFEFLNPDSATFQFFASWIDTALNRARGATLQKAILQAIARQGPLRLSQIAREIYRPAPVTKAMLERLMLTDIIVKEDNRFDFACKPLGRWYRIVSSLDSANLPSVEEKNRLVRILEGIVE